MKNIFLLTAVENVCWHVHRRDGRVNWDIVEVRVWREHHLSATLWCFLALGNHQLCVQVVVLQHQLFVVRHGSVFSGVHYPL